MNFNTKRSLFSFSRAPGVAVKQWGLGWTVAEASRSAKKAHRDPQQKQVPGTYGLLVGFTPRS